MKSLRSALGRAAIPILAVITALPELGVNLGAFVAKLFNVEEAWGTDKADLLDEDQTIFKFRTDVIGTLAKRAAAAGFEVALVTIDKDFGGWKVAQATLGFERSSSGSGHRRKGGTVVTVRDGHIVVAAGKDERRVARLDHLPITHGGRIGFQVDNVLAAAAAAWRLGVPLELVRLGLETFPAGMTGSPGAERRSVWWTIARSASARRRPRQACWRRTRKPPRVGRS